MRRGLDHASRKIKWPFHISLTIKLLFLVSWHFDAQRTGKIENYIYCHVGCGVLASSSKLSKSVGHELRFRYTMYFVAQWSLLKSIFT